MSSPALVALQGLSATQDAMKVVQTRLSSGLRVRDASDNPAYWALSTHMRSTVEAINASCQAIDNSLYIVSRFSDVYSQVLDNLNGIKNDVFNVSQGIISTDTIQGDIAKRQKSILNLMSSYVNGVNISDGSTNGLSLVDGSYDTAGGTRTQKVNLITVDNANQFALGGKFSGDSLSVVGGGGLLGQSLGLSTASQGVAGSAYSFGFYHHDGHTTLTCFGTYVSDSILGFTLTKLSGSGSTNNDLQLIQSGLDVAIRSVIDDLAKIGGVSTILQNQATYNQALSNAISSGLGSLVDADLNGDSILEKALNVQAMLKVQMLSIVNENYSLAIKLFEKIK